METLFIGGLYNVELSEDLAPPIDIGAGLQIARGERFVDRLISSARQRRMGGLEVDFLKRRPFVYSKEFLRPGVDFFDYLVHKIKLVNRTIHYSWLHGDNAVNLDRGFLLARDNFGNDVIHSNFIAYVHSDAAGNFRRAVSWDSGLINLVAKLNGQDESAFGAESGDKKPSRDRVARALYFLTAARATSQIEMKVTFYCSAFEALFSTSNAEIANQLAVRLSLFLTPKSEDRQSIYKQAKSAYGVRSKLIHGDVVRHDEALIKTSEECDKMLRNVLLRVARSKACRELFELSTEKLENEFMRATLGFRVPGIVFDDVCDLEGAA